MAAQTLLFVLAAILILTGLAGTVVPILPGVPLVFAGMWLAAATDHYQHVGTITLIILGALSVFALLIDFIASIAGAKRVGASGRAIWGASIGMIVGIFFGLIGLLLGPFIGALIGELSSGSTMHRPRASASARGSDCCSARSRKSRCASRCSACSRSRLFSSARDAGSPPCFRRGARRRTA